MCAPRCHTFLGGGGGTSVPRPCPGAQGDSRTHSLGGVFRPQLRVPAEVGLSLPVIRFANLVFPRRPLWVLVSSLFARTWDSDSQNANRESSAHPRSNSISNAPRPSVFKIDADLLFALVQELYRRGRTGAGVAPISLPAGGENGPSSSSPSMLVYESVVLVTLSRILGQKDCRAFTSIFLLRLPVVPSWCLSLLAELSQHGSLPGGSATSTPVAGPGSGTGKDKGTRWAAMVALGKVACKAAEEHDEAWKAAGDVSLGRLLEMSVCGDFWSRSTAVTLLVE